MRFGDATCRGRASGRRGRRKRCERGPSFVERGRGAARRSAEQSARICRKSFFSLRGRVTRPPLFSLIVRPSAWTNTTNSNAPVRRGELLGDLGQSVRALAQLQAWTCVFFWRSVTHPGTSRRNLSRYIPQHPDAGYVRPGLRAHRESGASDATSGSSRRATGVSAGVTFTVPPHTYNHIHQCKAERGARTS